MAYYRRAQGGLPGPGRVAGAGFPPDTYPDPVDHCDVCRWAVECGAQRRRDDDLSLVAGIARRTRRELRDDRQSGRGAASRASTLPLAPELRHTKGDALGRVRRQAAIQVRGEDEGRPLHELILPPARMEDGVTLDRTKGLVSLPEPRPGDLFLDLEGDPFAFDDGIDYLFGILELRPDGGRSSTPSGRARRTGG